MKPVPAEAVPAEVNVAALREEDSAAGKVADLVEKADAVDREAVDREAGDAAGLAVVAVVETTRRRFSSTEKSSIRRRAVSFTL